MAPAFTIAALGAIESLLSAMVADGMAETRHDPNQELIGPGHREHSFARLPVASRRRSDRAHRGEHSQWRPLTARRRCAFITASLRRTRRRATR